MSNERDEESDLSGPELAERRAWPIRAKAARTLGVSARTVARLAERGEIETWLDPDGPKRYNPGDLEELAQMGAPPSPPQDPAQVTFDLFRGAAGHIDRLISVIVDPREKMTAVLLSTNDSLRARVQALETERTDWLRQYEELQTETFKRQLARDEFERRQARLDRGVEELANHAPRFVMQVLANRRIKELLTSFSPEQMTVLEQSGFLDEEQVRVLREIRDEPASNDNDSKSPPVKKDLN